MGEEAIKQRFRRAKSKTLGNLLNVYKIVIPVPKPNHFFCPKSNMFIRVEINDLNIDIEKRLIDFKNNCSKDTILQVHVYKKYYQKPEIIEIK